VRTLDQGARLTKCEQEKDMHREANSSGNQGRKAVHFIWNNKVEVQVDDLPHESCHDLEVVERK
jgi:hypothetical protein